MKHLLARLFGARSPSAAELTVSAEADAAAELPGLRFYRCTMGNRQRNMVTVRHGSAERPLTLC